MVAMNYRGAKAYERAKQTGVLIMRAADIHDYENYAPANWHKYCQDNLLPVIVVTLFSSTALLTINFQFTSAATGLSPDTHAWLATLIRDASQVTKRSRLKVYQRPYARIHLNAVYAEGLRRDKLQEFLNALVYLVYVDELHLERPLESVAL